MFTDEISDQTLLVNSSKTTIINAVAVIVEGVKKIISISNSEIVIRLGTKKILNIIGEKLHITKLEPQMCQITGKIVSVNFEGKND